MSHHHGTRSGEFATPQHTDTASAPLPVPSGALLEALGTTITPDLLVEALTHRSFAHEHPGTANYERLEFLGDAVLELVVTETLFAAHPDMTEGQLAKMRAKYILLGRGESDDGGADKSSILCDIVEALIGATFVEHGIETAREVVHRLIDDTLREVATEGPALDWKTSLVVKAHELGLEEPRYRMEVSGPEYAQVFTARAILGDAGTQAQGAAGRGRSRMACAGHRRYASMWARLALRDILLLRWWQYAPLPCRHQRQPAPARRRAPRRPPMRPVDREPTRAHDD